MAIKTYLTSDEIQKMVANARCTRDQVIITFYADTGCRVSELLELRVENLDLDANTILIPHLKRGTKKKCPNCNRSAGRTQSFCSKCGNDLSKIQAEGIKNRGRIISIGKDLSELLKEYTGTMHASEKLIGLSRQQVYLIVRELAEKIGLTGRAMINPETRKRHYVHPHNFRDALAVNWIQSFPENASMHKALQDHLGHARFETTMRYNKLNPSEVQSAADKVREIRFGKQAPETPTA